MNYKDKVVLVTGSSRGLGKSIISEYAKEGAIVIINYINSDDKAMELKKYLEDTYHSEVMLCKCDISNEDMVKDMINNIINKYHKLDILVNNAATTYDSLVEDKNKDTWRKVLDTNLIGTFLVSKYASKYMPLGSSMVNISSTNGIDTYYPYSMDYDASKAGIISMTKNMAVYYEGKIRVNCVCPGWMNTDMNKDLDKNYIKEEEDKIILGRFADSQEVANVVLFLTSNKASYVNGSIIVVDGGRKV